MYLVPVRSNSKSRELWYSKITLSVNLTDTVGKGLSSTLGMLVDDKYT